MPTSRDERVTKAPPAGLIERLAGGGTVSSGAPFAAIDESKTDPDGTDFEIMQDRAARAARNAHAAATIAIATNAEIAKVRAELRQDIGNVSVRLDDALKEFTETRIEVAGVVSVLGRLEKSVDLQTATLIEHRTITMTAQVDVAKAGALDVVDAKKFRRDLIGKTVATVLSGTGLVAIVIALISSRC